MQIVINPLHSVVAVFTILYPLWGTRLECKGLNLKISPIITHFYCRDKITICQRRSSLSSTPFILAVCFLDRLCRRFKSRIFSISQISILCNNSGLYRNWISSCHFILVIITYKRNINGIISNKAKIFISNLHRFTTNRYLRVDRTQDVEWGYSFDIHLNAFFPPLIILHFLQLFLYNGKHFLIIELILKYYFERS